MHEFFSWEVVGWVVALLAPGGLGLLALSDYRLAKICFLISGLMLEGKVVVWGIDTPHSLPARLVISALLFALIGISVEESWRYVDSKNPAKPQEQTSTKDDTVNSQTLPTHANEQKELITSLVQYVAMNRIGEISDELSLNLRVQMQRQKYLLTKSSLPFNYFQFGNEVIYRAREGNWGGDVITPGTPLSTLGVHEWSNEVSFVVRSPKMSEDAAQLKAFSDNLLLPPPIKWDLDQYIHAWGESEEAIADVLNEEAQKGHFFSPLDQDVLQQELFRRLESQDVLVKKLADDARQYI